MHARTIKSSLNVNCAADKINEKQTFLLNNAPIYLVMQSVDHEMKGRPFRVVSHVHVEQEAVQGVLKNRPEDNSRNDVPKYHRVGLEELR